MARYERVSTYDDSSPWLAATTARWSMSVGVWSGVPVRMHVSLAVVLVLAVGACVYAGSSSGWLLLVAYVTSLAVHESAHGLAVARLRRGRASRFHPSGVLLGPCGGMGVGGESSDPREQVFVAMAGPLASLSVVVASVCCLAAVEGPPLESLTNPVLTDPLALIGGAAAKTPLGELAAALVAINWPLFLINLAPASPFDGGVALRSWLRLWLGKQAAHDATLFVALFAAALLLVGGAALVLTKTGPPVVGAVLASFAVVVAFGARIDAGEVTLSFPLLGAGDDDSFGVSLRELRPASLSDTAEHRLVTAELRRSEKAAPGDPDDRSDDRVDDAQVDDILAKVHVRGVHSLSANERAILERASQSYQRRLRERD